MDAKITMLGPCGVTWFTFETELGQIILFHTHLPNEILKQQVEFTWYAEPSVPKLLAWYVVGNWVSQWRNDIEIWSNKMFVRKPLLVKGDGPIMQMRRWYKQFYSTLPVAEKDEGLKSPAREGSLEW